MVSESVIATPASSAAQRAVLVYALLGIVAIGGCQTAPYEPVATRPPVATAGVDGEALVQMARAADPSTAVELWLRAAAAFVSDGRYAAATQALASIRSDDTSPAASDETSTATAASAISQTHQFQAQALRVEIALQLRDPEGVKALLVDLLPATAEQDQQYRDLALRLRSLDIDPVTAARTLLATQPPNRANQQQHNDQIWSSLGRVPATMARQLAATTQGNERGWWQLQSEMLAAFSVADQRMRLNRWRTTNANHSASQWLPSALIPITQSRENVNHLVLLVPQSGALAAAGQSVRDGFVAAHLFSGQSSSRQLTVLDTATAPLPELLQQATALGADMLIGPLDKTRVEQFNLLPRSIPALVLNYLPPTTAPTPSLLQLGLAVEDEALAIGRRLVGEGHERIVVLHNEQGWSLRARDALLRSIDEQTITTAAQNISPQVDFGADYAPAVPPQDGMSVVGFGSTPNVRELTSVVGSTLLVAASSARHKRLERQLGGQLEFTPRARKDVSAIVAFLDGPEARALRPALKFHFSSHLPVYTSSQSLRRVAARDLRDLRGFNLSEIPWKLYPTPIRTEVEDAFANASNAALAPLYALGVDAYRLADRLDMLLREPNQRLLGGTGELSLQRDGRVRRELSWQYVGADGLIPLPMMATPSTPQLGGR